MYGHERSLVKEMQDQPFALIGVNSDKDLAKIRQVVQDKELPWRSFQNNPDGAAAKISTTWAIKGWPTLVILDEEMRIRYRGHSGDAAIKKAKQLVAKLAKKSGGQPK